MAHLQRRVACRYAAGKALLAAVNGLAVAGVGVGELLDGTFVTAVNIEPAEDPTDEPGYPHDRRVLEAKVLARLAGPAAVLIGGFPEVATAPPLEPGDAIVVEGAFKNLGPRSLSIEHEAWLSYLWHRAINDLTVPLLWAGVERLAEELDTVGQLTREQILAAARAGAQTAHLLGTIDEDRLLDDLREAWVLAEKLHRVPGPFALTFEPPEPGTGEDQEGERSSP